MCCEFPGPAGTSQNFPVHNTSNCPLPRFLLHNYTDLNGESILKVRLLQQLVLYIYKLARIKKMYATRLNLIRHHSCEINVGSRQQPMHSLLDSFLVCIRLDR